MNLIRSGGILLHPTSLPGPDGIGDLGPQAYYWIDFLKASGCDLWQVLPLGPTGYGDSPYQSFSAFAGNPYLISSAFLLDEGLLTLTDLEDRPEFPSDHVDFGSAIPWKLTLLDRAYARFEQKIDDYRDEFEAFCNESDGWLRDYALFMAIKDAQNGICWLDWPNALKDRHGEAVRVFEAAHSESIRRYEFQQFLFSRQWANLKKYALENHISIIGDIPIFVSKDSADVWSHPELFFLDDAFNPTVVAGVPPDYFSPTGQLWGNPLYNWKKHKENGYAWWIERVRKTLKTCDLIRLDHFRGFSGYWEVPAGNPTAEFGRWVEGPGADFIQHIQDALGSLPLIAEDLGDISADVIELRDHFALPGMKVLQFSFSDPANLFLPCNFTPNFIAYTGTHDNDTSVSWYEHAPESDRDFARKYLASDGCDIAWDMIRAVWQSVAVFSLAPLQDFLSLGGSARMNQPNNPQGNWQYRFRVNHLTPELALRIREINKIYNRLNDGSPKAGQAKLIPYEQA